MLLSKSKKPRLLHFLEHTFKHYVNATWIDVLHSPFVFALYNQCVRRQWNDNRFIAIETLRKSLLKDITPVQQLDLGAYAERTGTRFRTVAQIARQDAKPKRMATILHDLVRYTQSEYCIELGTSLGLTSAYLAAALPPNGILHTIEGASEIADKAAENLQSLGYAQKIQQHVGAFDDVLPGVLAGLPRVDLVFIDGNHSYEATLRYAEMIKPYVHNNTVIVFDDIYWSAGMTNAWEEIKADKLVQVTVDLCFIGLVFFRNEQARQHFKLRIW